MKSYRGFCILQLPSVEPIRNDGARNHRQLSHHRKFWQESLIQTNSGKLIYHMKEEIKSVLWNVGSRVYEQNWRSYGQKLITS